MGLGGFEGAAMLETRLQLLCRTSLLWWLQLQGWRSLNQAPPRRTLKRCGLAVTHWNPLAEAKSVVKKDKPHLLVGILTWTQIDFYLPDRKSLGNITLLLSFLSVSVRGRNENSSSERQSELFSTSREEIPQELLYFPTNTHSQKKKKKSRLGKTRATLFSSVGDLLNPEW